MTTSKKQQGPVFLSVNDIEFKQQEWLWDKLIPVDEVTVLHGHGGIGKSGLLAALVARIAHGHDKFLGRSIKSGFRALWIDGEMGKFGFKRRITWALNALDHQEPEGDKRIIYTDLRPLTLRDSMARKKVREKAQELDIRLLI